MRDADAARILLRRRRMRASLAGFAQSIQIPGAPVGGDDSELFAPVGADMARHHNVMCDEIQRCLETRYGRLILMLPPGAAKALALDTPIPTPTGWTTMGALRVGDQVLDENGKPCNVTWVSPVWRDREVYSVRTDCGDAIVADVDHEWRVRLCGKHGKYSIKETRDLVRARSKRPMIERAKVIDLPSADLPLDPYLLGVWLGDGTSEAGEITASEADMPWMRAQFEASGFATRDRAGKSQRFGVAGLRGHLVRAGVLKNKHVPDAYLRAAPAQRLALLQGLIDTDGTVCRRRGAATFTNTNRRLAEAVQELARSLGVKAGFCENRATLNGRDCGPVYRVSFYHAQAARMPRKAALCRDQQRTPNTYIDLERAPNCDTVCIEVDSPSHLFLCGRSMTPTHNSTYASAIAPAWAMAKWPGWQGITVSYGTELAKKHAKKARAIFKQAVVADAFGGIALDRSTSAAELWRTTNGSEYMAAGILAGITGSRADAVFGDDLIAGAQEADSPATRAATWEAWEMDVMTRLKPGGSVVLLGTRWHPLDPIGMLLPDDYKGQSGPVLCKDGMVWRVLNIPAEAEHADDPIGRATGEMLWPEWFDAQHWEPHRRKARTWASLFQQRPAIGGGGQFKREWIRWYAPGQEPKHLNRYGFSDYAAPNPDKPIDDPDFIEHGVWGLCPEGDVWALDWWSGQCTTDKGMDAVVNLMKKWRPRKWWNEKGPIWNAIANLLSDKMRRNSVRCGREALPSSVNKLLRAETFFGMAEQGRVHFPDVPWAHRVVDQLCAFPVVAHDDAVDVCSLMGRALHKLAYAYVPQVDVREDLRPGSVAWLLYEEPAVAKGGRTL